MVEALLEDVNSVDINFQDRYVEGCSLKKHTARSHLASVGAHSWGGTALADAVREGHASIATLLRSKGGELLYSEIKASGDLCEFARQGDVKSVKMLLSSGCSADAADYDKVRAVRARK